MATISKQQKRIQKDILTVKDCTLESHGFYIDPKTFDKKEWEIYLQGPLDTIWQDGVFKLCMSFPDKYPFQPVKIKFAHGIYHPNVGHGGTICVDIIQTQWSPSFSLRALFDSLRSLLCDPNPDSPMNGEAARNFRQKNSSKKGATYYEKVTESVKKYGQELKSHKRQVDTCPLPNKDNGAASSSSSNNKANDLASKSSNQITTATETSSGAVVAPVTTLPKSSPKAPSTAMKSSTSMAMKNSVSASGLNAGSSSGVTTTAMAKAPAMKRKSASGQESMKRQKAGTRNEPIELSE